MESTHSVHAKYDIGKVLGTGGYATVREAVSKSDQSVVALKMMNRENLDATSEKNIRSEVSLLQSLNHPNIVRGFEFFEEPKQFYFVLEKVDGGELFDRIVKKTHYNEKEARDLVRVLLNGIKYCHDRNIAHRDLKPENLLMVSEDDDAELKIVDFGFAAHVRGMSLSKQCGTPGYVAPEILENKLHGTPVDMWSFGVILFILLGGYPPFHDSDQKNLYRKIKSAAYEFHPKYWSTISDEAKDLINKLLVVNPLRRYTADQALAHPWLHVDDHVLAATGLQVNVEELKKFQAGRKLKAGMHAVLAVSKLKKLMGSLYNMREAMEEEARPHTLDARYELGAVLGEGGYAVVRSGVSKGTDRKEVAVKVMNRDRIDRDTEVSIRTEVSVLQSLDHPNIVRAYELFEETDSFAFVQEKISGGELFDRIVKKTFYSEVEARQLAAVLLKAIKYCHDHNIAHRDLKPENLLMVSENDDAELKIVDFGFAAITHGNTLTSQCGTPGYIAPEILFGRPHGVAVDMWSFGVILYILLGGYPPFHDEDQKELFRKIKAGEFIFHEEYWGGVTAQAKDLISKLLTVNPAERLTADQALAHPWMHSSDAGNLPTTLAELRKFQAAKRFKKGVNAIKAINKMKKIVSSLAFLKANQELPHTIDARYTLGDTLGEGGYAVVKQAVSKVDNLDVAVKVMTRTHLDEKAENAIRQEVKILQSLDHPNIVGALDFFEEKSHFYFVLEKVNGGELFDRIVQKTFYSEKEARDLIKVLLNTLNYMHSNNIVHRDLKPENLLMTNLDDDADVKIVDFGFAAQSEGSNLSEQCGTPGYIAPEILMNKLHGSQVDLWSLGVILYILLGGYPPFHDEDQNELFKRIKAGVYEFHEEYWSAVSEEAKDLISKLLVVNPLERLTAQQALQHPWLVSDEEKLANLALDSAKAELKKFQAKKRFKKGVNAIKAINRMKNILGGLGKLKATVAATETAEGASSTEAAAATPAAEAVVVPGAAEAAAVASAAAAADAVDGLKDDTRI